VKVNCGAIPEQLFESEFFGHAKGAFTGAIADRPGRFELAHGGTLFLDEIGEVPLALQSKLLRVLQEKQFERVGEARTRTVDVRVIAATNRNLRREAAQGRFREDLFYRLTVFPIDLPPLRDRAEDIPRLAAHFLQSSAARLNLRLPRLTRDRLRTLQSYAWPGNVRELENVIERAVILSRASGKLQLDLPARGPVHMPPPLAIASNPPEAPPKPVLTRAELNLQERANILAALEQTRGRIFGSGGAAALLGMRPTTLASRIKSLGIKKRFD
jgi:transcriptional regulator with GAF, ATPase, and Fis domain